MPTEASAETLTIALARLESRWGSAAVRLASDVGASRVAGRRTAKERPTAEEINSPQVDGALALAFRAQPAPEFIPTDVTRPTSLPDEIVPTGFTRLDALLGTGGLPRGVSASFRGTRSSGKT